MFCRMSHRVVFCRLFCPTYYANDTSRCLSYCELYQYADGTFLLLSYLNCYKSVEMLQRDIIRFLMDWNNCDWIGININNTKLVRFHNPVQDRPPFLYSSQCSACSCAPLEYVFNVKYLGIYFKHDFFWSLHLEDVRKRLRSVSSPTKLQGILYAACQAAISRY